MPELHTADQLASASWLPAWTLVKNAQLLALEQGQLESTLTLDIAGEQRSFAFAALRVGRDVRLRARVQLLVLERDIADLRVSPE